jgi:hypothetical protein
VAASSAFGSNAYINGYGQNTYVPMGFNVVAQAVTTTGFNLEILSSPEEAIPKQISYPLIIATWIACGN